MKTNMRSIFTLAISILLSSFHTTTAQTCSGVVANVTASTPSVNATTSTWTVPAGGPYLIKITAAGAMGGSGGYSGGAGATMQGNFVVNSGQILNITAGAPGALGYGGGGGGGGSGVYIQNGVSQNILIIAGGGGGASSNYLPGAGPGLPGVTTTTGTSASNDNCSVQPGGTGGGGGGYATPGANGYVVYSEYSGLHSGGGGGGGAGFTGVGGFGDYPTEGFGGGGVGAGGGGTWTPYYATGAGGAGGGYNGGLATCRAGGGGGSINNGTNQTNTAGANAGGGYVTIECLGALSPTTASVSSSLNPSFTGNSVNFTATVTSQSAPVTEGTVTFKEGATVLSSGVALNGSGQATFSTSGLTEGSHNITAYYNGSNNYISSNGAVTQVVNNPTQANGNSFCNSLSGITLSSGSSTNPYPSNIFVSGITGTVNTVTVNVNNLTATAPGEIALMLVGPGGQKFVMMSGVGGSTAVSGINLLLSDGGVSPPSALTSGTFKPACTNTASFPAPAPGSFGFAAPFGSSTFYSVFWGINPNGAWNLYAIDNGGNTASIGSWCLNFTITPACPAGNIAYVNANATGANNGTSWTDAFTKLQDALTLTNSCPAITQIWVAAGTYKPTTGTDRTVSFVMKNGLAIYGGFAGGETQLSQRNWTTNVTALSGDLNGDDVVTGNGATLSITNNGENSLHVIFNFNNGLNATAVLDGFTIEGGNANDISSFPNYVGGGMLNRSASPMVTNCVFSGNSNRNAGGGMYNLLSSPTLSNCSFLENSCELFEGGGMYNASSSSPILTNCSFSGNRAGRNGGGMYNDASSPTLTNCSFSGNSSVGDGGGMMNGGSSPILTNCSFSGNNGSSGGGIYNESSSPALTNCIVWGNSSGMYNDQPGTTITYSIVQGGYSGTGNLNTDPLFVDAATGDLRLQACSPAINSGSDAANSTTTDLAGNDRKVGTIDMGAYEFQGTVPAAPSINTQPQAQSVCQGEPATQLTVGADGAGLTYQWYSNTNNSNTGGTPVPAATTASYTPPTYATGILYYYVVVSNTCGIMVNSDAAAVSVTQPFTWYKDADNDNYSDGTTLTACDRPTGYKLSTELTASSGDCDDNDNTKWQSALLFIDVDGDGYNAGQTTVCYGATVPTGYSLTTSGSDCNDADASVHAPLQYYVDADHDGYGSTTTAMLCSSTAPVGYSTNNTDCNDADASVHEPQLYYVDNDRDGYGSTTTAMICSSTPPIGYSTRTGDCNDANAAVNPGAAEICGNGIDDNCNGQVDEGCSTCGVTATVSTGSISCYGGLTTITVKASGGKTPYQYKLSGGLTFQLYNTFIVGAGTYSVTVKDKTGCTKTISNIVITQPGLLTLTLVQKKDVTCRNGSNGLISVSAGGGTSPYSYKLNSGSYKSSGLFQNLKAGTYTVTAKDAKGCIKSMSIIIKNGTGSCNSLAATSEKLTEWFLEAQVMPNPTVHEFTLNLKGSSSEPVTIRVMDMYGRTIYLVKGSANQSYKFGQRFASGAYLVEIMQGGHIKTLKVIKN